MSKLLVNWKEVKGFSKGEFEPYSEDGSMLASDLTWDMHPTLIYQLQDIRERGVKKYHRFQVVVHRNGGLSLSGHSPTSLHYGSQEHDREFVKDLTGLDRCLVGRACDFHCRFMSGDGIWVGVPWLDQALIVMAGLDELQYGLGFMPNWNQQGCHLDVRLGIRTPAVWWKKDGGEYRNYVWGDLHEALRDVILYRSERIKSGGGGLV